MWRRVSSSDLETCSVRYLIIMINSFIFSSYANAIPRRCPPSKQRKIMTQGNIIIIGCQRNSRQTRREVILGKQGLTPELVNLWNLQYWEHWSLWELCSKSIWHDMRRFVHGDLNSTYCWEMQTCACNTDMHLDIRATDSDHSAAVCSACWPCWQDGNFKCDHVTPVIMALNPSWPHMALLSNPHLCDTWYKCVC